MAVQHVRTTDTGATLPRTVCIALLGEVSLAAVTWSEIARELGVSRAVLSEIVRGRHPITALGRAKLRRVLGRHGVDAAELLA